MKPTDALRQAAEELRGADNETIRRRAQEILEESSSVEVPAWYQMVATARYANVPVWELAGRELWWFNIYRAAMIAEAKAEKARAEKIRRQNKPKKHGQKGVMASRLRG